MTDFICQRLDQDYARVVLARGEGETWAELFASWDDATGWNLSIEKSDEYVDLHMIYDYFRHREMSWLELRREFEYERDRSKMAALEEKVRSLRGELTKAGCDEMTFPMDLFARMEAKIDNLTDLLVQQKTAKEWYTIVEVAQRLGRAEFTVREWCRLGQCQAEKKKIYRGGKKQWMIHHDEMLRLEEGGPAPLQTFHA